MILGGRLTMVRKEITILNELGLESKTAAMFIQKASNYKSSVWIEKGSRKANAKSLLGLLSLGISKGTSVYLVVEGEDEEKAALELEGYSKTGFGDIS